MTMPRIAVALGVLTLASLTACGRDNVELAALDDTSRVSDAGAEPHDDASGIHATTDAGGDASEGSAADAGAIPDATGPGQDADAGGGIDPTTGCPTDVLLCEGLDSSPAGWTLSRSENGSIATVPDGASGKGSLEASTSSSGAFAYAARGGLPAVEAGKLYLRTFVKVPLGQTIHDYEIAMLGNAPASEGVVVTLSGGHFSLSSRAQGTTQAGAGAIPRDTWFCLELDVTLADSGGVATLRIDGSEDVSLVDIDSRPTGGYTWCGVGILRTTPLQTSARVLIDDLVVATSPIGCN